MPVAQGCIDVALRLPGVIILSQVQAQIYLDTEKTKAETEKIQAEKMESNENKAQRAHEIAMKTMEHAHELTKKKSQAPAPTTTTAKAKAAAASAAPTPAKEKAREKAFPQAGIRKPTSSRAKKGARGKEIVLMKQTTERITSHFSRK